MNGKKLFLEAMSDYIISSNTIKNKINSEWNDWDYNIDYNLETTKSSSDSSTDYNIIENYKSPMYKIPSIKFHEEKDFGTLKVLEQYPFGKEYKKQIEKSIFLPKKTCFIYKKLNTAQLRDIIIFVQNNKMRYEIYGEEDNRFIAIWGGKK